MARVAILIEEFVMDVYLGVNSDEQKERRRVPMDVRFEYNWLEMDELSKAVDYRQIRDNICEAVHNVRFSLIESLAHAVLEVLKADNRILRAVVTIKKGRALRLSKCVTAIAEWDRDLL